MTTRASSTAERPAARLTDKAPVAISFAILFAGFLSTVRALRTATRPHPAAGPTPVTAAA